MAQHTISRRDALVLAAGSLTAGLTGRLSASPPDPFKVKDVKIGVQSYSFHDVPNDGANHADRLIANMQKCGLSTCEVWSGHIEATMVSGVHPSTADCPKPEVGCAPGKGGSQRNAFAWVFSPRQGEDRARTRRAIREFLESKPAAFFEAIRRQFDDAGIEVYAYNPYMDPGGRTPDMPTTDAEIDGLFVSAKALGVKAINASVTRTMLNRLIPFAEKHQLVIAPHGHSLVSHAEEFSTRETFTSALALSKWVGVNLDIGHYTAAGEDPVEFVKSFHDRITNIHLKDRKRNSSSTAEDGANMPWGQGDTPIGEVLRLIRDKAYDIPCMIEIEHMGTTSAVDEVRIAYEYCKRELAKP